MIGNEIGYYIILLAVGIVSIIFAYHKKELALILNTTFIGSYLVIRGLSFYIGGFPNETDIVLIISQHILQRQNYNKVFYFYLLGILLLFAASFSFKIWKFKKS